MVALAKLGRFPVDLVERALLDKGEDMILVLAKAAGCSWTTVKELLLMYVAERNLQTEDLARTFERYSKLTPDTARNIVNFYGQRVKLRAQKTRGAGSDRNAPSLVRRDGRLRRRDYCRPSCERMPQLRRGCAVLSLYLWQSVINTGS